MKTNSSATSAILANEVDSDLSDARYFAGLVVKVETATCLRFVRAQSR
jgi:hypothetical protein